MKYTGARERIMESSEPPLRLLDKVRAAVRVRHYSRRTEQVYVAWIRRFVLANGKRHQTSGVKQAGSNKRGQSNVSRENLIKSTLTRFFVKNKS